jgi:hypothetical protein
MNLAIMRVMMTLATTRVMVSMKLPTQRVRISRGMLRRGTRREQNNMN